MGNIDLTGLLAFAIVGMVLVAGAVGSVALTIIALPFALWQHNIDILVLPAIGGFIAGVLGFAVFTFWR